MSDTKLDEASLALSKNICKAWVNFNGTGTISEYDSFNVLTLDDDGTGWYTVNFNKDMSDVNFAASGATDTSTNFTNACFGTRAVGSCVMFVVHHPANTRTDTDNVCAIFYGN